MRRPVWLLSEDTEQFRAPPMTTGALAAHFQARGRTAAATEVELVHFLEPADRVRWVEVEWDEAVVPRAREALDRGLEPVLGLSCYTWNVAELLEISRRARDEVPGLLIVAGGPHVQCARDFLGEDGIDVVVLGEGEETFTDLLDAPGREAWSSIAGLAYLDDDGGVIETAERPRATDLDRFPSALDAIELRDETGEPRYRQVAYETARGCPYRCSFCEWGTGAIGTKMFQKSLDRIRDDLERLVEGGLQDIWLADSNFGALREDLEKAKIFVDLKQRTGRPQTFATSWSKNHNQRVQEIVRLLHANQLLVHYHLALQTLTPGALELSHRTNMRANDYEPIVKQLAAEGVPIAAELMWPLPGDTLADFEGNLDHLLTVFPDVNIFAYTLLPGTEFYDRRDELEIEALPVEGYGKAKGEYVVGCRSFSRDEGEEGYLLLTAWVMLSRGSILPNTTRFVALDGRLSASSFLRAVLRDLARAFASEVPDLDPSDRIRIYERRAELYLVALASLDRTFERIGRTVEEALDAADLEDADREELRERLRAVIAVDHALCPRVGPTRTIRETFAFAADEVARPLAAMNLPDAGAWEPRRTELVVHHPARVGEVLKDPDGGSWMRGTVVGVRRLDDRSRSRPPLAAAASL